MSDWRWLGDALVGAPRQPTMPAQIEVGDVVEHMAVAGQRYEVVALVNFVGLPHATVRPLPPGSGPTVPIPIGDLKVVSKGGVQ